MCFFFGKLKICLKIHTKKAETTHIQLALAVKASIYSIKKLKINYSINRLLKHCDNANAKSVVAARKRFFFVEKKLFFRLFYSKTKQTKTIPLKMLQKDVSKWFKVDLTRKKQQLKSNLFNSCVNDISYSPRTDIIQYVTNTVLTNFYDFYI